MKNKKEQKQFLKQLYSEQKGAVLPFVALTATIVIAITGFAVDYSRAQMVKDRLQWALDAAALAGAREYITNNNDLGKAKDKATDYLTANFPQGFMGSSTPKIQIQKVSARPEYQEFGDGLQFSVSAVKVDGYFTDFLGGTGLEVNALSEVNTLPAGPLDIAFAIDVSNSMVLRDGTGGTGCSAGAFAPAGCFGSPTRLDAAKGAMESIVTLLGEKDSGNRFGVVPFDNKVNGFGALQITGAKASYDCPKSDSPATNKAKKSLMLAPYAHTGNAIPPVGYDDCRRFNPVGRPHAENTDVMEPMLYLTDKYGTKGSNAAKTVFASIKAQYADGSTDGALGMLWAIRQHYPDFYDPKMPGPAAKWIGEKTTTSTKVIVFMTDGNNTSFYGEPDPGDVASSIVNARQAELCEAAKKKGITIYTIAYSLNGPTNESIKAAYEMLEGCASNKKYFFPASNGGALTAAMKSIASSLMTMRLTK